MALLDGEALAGRTVLLTGASGGIGRVTAGLLAGAGAHVVAQHRSGRAEAERALAGVPETARTLIEADLSTPRAARQLWRDVDRRRRVDVLVVNAAVSIDTPLDGPDELWDAGWEETLRVNVLGAGALLREATRAFAERGGGVAVVVSSWAALQGSRIRDVSAYAASKAAIRNLAQTLARAYVRDGVQVHVVAPGVVDAGIAVRGMDAEARAAVAGGLAMGRHVAADEVAAMIGVLATGAFPALTGSTVDVNGASYIR
jgi:NAD(P)-dependent dehydrogenase (short-subunit alcohol dehydrogenase family)